MTFTIFDRRGLQKELSEYEYLTHLLKITDTEMRIHLLIRKQSENNLLDKKELKFQNWKNRSNLRFLIYDFIELKECKSNLFKRNHYILNQHIKLLTKALNCKDRQCKHPIIYKRNDRTQYNNFYYHIRRTLN